jgi:hypothetical protein
VLAALQPGSRKLATSKGLRYGGPQEASETVQLGYKLAPDHDTAVLEFAPATSLHHDAITGESGVQLQQTSSSDQHAAIMSAVHIMALNT